MKGTHEMIFAQHGVRGVTGKGIIEHFVLIQLVDHVSGLSSQLRRGGLHQWLKIGFEHFEYEDGDVVHDSLQT
jgi:hypothetical protein